MDVPGYGEVSTEILRAIPEKDFETALDKISVNNGGGNADRWALAERARRQSIEMGRAIAVLTQATEKVHGSVTTLADSSGRLEGMTDRLITLTDRLIILTKWLIVLAIAAVIVPIVIEFYHAYHHEVQDVRGTVDPPSKVAPLQE